jgi:hypothetical protein
LANQLAKLAEVRYTFLVPLILTFVLLGAFSTNRDPLDLVAVICFGILGYFMWRLGYPRPAMILGFVLGELFERYLYRSVASYGFAWLQRPSVIILLILALGTLALTLRSRREDKPKAESALGNRHLSIRFRPGSLLTLYFLSVFVLAIAVGWQWPIIAKLMPVYSVAIPGIFLALSQLYREVTAWERPEGERSTAHEADEVFESRLDRQTEIWRTLGFFGWFVGGALAIWLLGIVMGLPLVMLFYTLIEGGESWRLSLLTSAGIFLMIWGLFEYMLETRWPPGILFG